MTTHAAGYEGAELHLYTRAAAKIDHQIIACHRCACGKMNCATRKTCPNLACGLPARRLEARQQRTPQETRRFFRSAVAHLTGEPLEMEANRGWPQWEYAVANLTSIGGCELDWHRRFSSYSHKRWTETETATMASVAISCEPKRHYRRRSPGDRAVPSHN